MVSLLRSEGSDTAAVEAKSARGGLPENLAHLVSAFANRPGGGTIILGLDENQGFAACRVFDLKAAQQGVASLARQAVEPPVQTHTEVVSFEQQQLVVIHVVEADPAGKPVRVKASGRAYLRQYGGTFPLSPLEEQAFVAARAPRQDDRQAVPESSLNDLDSLAVATFLRARRAQSSVFSGWPDDQVLHQAGVIADSGEVTLAGLLALGSLPQRFFPNLAIQASSWSGPARGARSRALDSAVIEGPVATMLEDAEVWVARNTASAIDEGPGGALDDAPQFPARAVRELVANALIHRDLGPYALRRYVSLTLEPDRLTITSPGGLFGLTVEALGHTDSSLRNGLLASILLSVRTPSGSRLIERLGSGIPAARDALRRAGLAEPQFFDTGLSFTARLLSRRLDVSGEVGRSGGDGGAHRSGGGGRTAGGDDGGRPGPGQPGTSGLGTAMSGVSSGVSGASADSGQRSQQRSSLVATPTQAAVVTALAAGPSTAADLSRQSGLTPRQVRYALRALVATGQVATNGATRGVRYRLA